MGKQALGEGCGVGTYMSNGMNTCLVWTPLERPLKKLGDKKLFKKLT